MDKRSIFIFENYRAYLRFYLTQLPQKRGALKAWSQHLRVHSTLVSQVMIGKRDFTEEQALELSDFIGHNQIEKEYFLELLRRERAGTKNLRKHHDSRILQLKNQALLLSERIHTEKKLTDHESAVFYSSWIYSAIRLCCSMDDGLSVDEISEKLNLPRTLIVDALKFLRDSGFVKYDGVRYSIGTQYTHLGKSSPFLVRHHNNWRVRSLQKADHLTDSELMYTAPFSISKKDFDLIREQLALVIQDFLKTVKTSEGELVACLNIDLFKVT